MSDSLSTDHVRFQLSLLRLACSLEGAAKPERPNAPKTVDELGFNPPRPNDR